MSHWLLLPLAYLLGSVNCAIITCQLLNLPDPRNQGSNNPGATNVMRIGGKKAAIVTLLGDMLKGLIPVLLAKGLGASTVVVAGVCLAAFIGHIFPVYFGFKGGKGVATSFGVLLGLNVWIGILTLATWVTVFKLSKLSSLSALIAAILMPLYMWCLEQEAVFWMMAMAMSVILLWRHQSNIKRLIQGEEK